MLAALILVYFIMVLLYDSFIYPLVVLLHGGPAGSFKDNFSYRWNYHLLASPGYVLVLTDYTGSTAGVVAPASVGLASTSNFLVSTVSAAG